MIQGYDSVDRLVSPWPRQVDKTFRFFRQLSTSYTVLPIPDHASFKHAVFHQQLGQGFFQRGGLSAQVFRLIRGGLPNGITGQAFLAGFQEFLAPPVIHIGINSFPASQFGNAGFASKAFQYNANLFFCGITASGSTTNIANRLLSAAFLVLSCRHHRSSSG